MMAQNEGTSIYFMRINFKSSHFCSIFKIIYQSTFKTEFFTTELRKKKPICFGRHRYIDYESRTMT